MSPTQACKDPLRQPTVREDATNVIAFEYSAARRSKSLALHTHSTNCRCADASSSSCLASGYIRGRGTAPAALIIPCPRACHAETGRVMEVSRVDLVERFLSYACCAPRPVRRQDAVPPATEMDLVLFPVLPGSERSARTEQCRTRTPGFCCRRPSSSSKYLAATRRACPHHL